MSEIKAALHETDELIAARSALRAADESVTRQRAHRKELELADASLETKFDFEKYLYTYRLWGRLGYNPDANPEIWRRALRRERDVHDFREGHPENRQE